MLEDLDHATRWLEAALRPDPGQRHRLLDAVSTLSDKPQLRVLLRSLLADRQGMAAAAAQSYAHPLGFDKLALIAANSFDYQLSLHVWWPGQKEVIEDVHNHRFSFASAVLDGALVMQAFERADAGAPMQEYESMPGDAVGISRFHRVGDAVLACSLSSRMPAGTIYYLSSRSLHRIATAGGDLTVTLFLQGPIVQPSTAVFSDQAIRQRPTITRPTMAPKAYAERVGAYVEALEATRPPSVLSH